MKINRKFNMRFVLIVITAFLLCASCISVDTVIRFNTNGSGEIDMTYTVSNALLSLGSYEGSPAIAAVPVEESNFNAAADSIEGLRIVSFSKTEDVDFTTITVSAAFGSPQALQTFLGGLTESCTFTSQNGDYVFVNTLYEAAAGIENQGLDDTTIEMIEGYFNDARINYTLELPQNGTNDGDGFLSQDRMRITYEESISDILKNNEDVRIGARW